MVRYYFDVRDDDGLTLDEDGRGVADAAAIDDWAISIADGIIRAELAMGTRRLAAFVLVREDAGAVVRELPFGYAIGEPPSE